MISAGPPIKPRTRRQKLANEYHLLRRDGPVKYVRLLRALRRFNRSVRRMAAAEGRDA